jgi:homoserine O-acetyltransferase/O-succinyltransferase
MTNTTSNGNAMKKLLLIALLGLSSLSFAVDYPNQKEGVWVAKNFQFHTGESFKELNMGYITLGNPNNPAILILHGTAGSAKGMLSKDFGEELFQTGQALDANKYFVIIPDAIGVGKSSKPSNGLKAQFPQYNYDDMVQAQYRLVSEGLGIPHLKLVLGNSMGGMQTWLWGIQHPQYMDYLAPMASTPSAMSGRNWMMRRFISEAVRRDPDWNNGNYQTQPKSAQFASVFYGAATSGGNQRLQLLAPNSEKADAIINERLSAPFTMDTNDFLYQWESSRDFDPGERVDQIRAKVLVINAADDERNPPELGIMEKQLKKIKSAQLFLIPSSDQTSGHSTTGQARWWKDRLKQFLEAH